MDSGHGTPKGPSQLTGRLAAVRAMLSVFGTTGATVLLIARCRPNTIHLTPTSAPPSKRG